jgi:hypothetical protein
VACLKPQGASTRIRQEAQQAQQRNTQQASTPSATEKPAGNRKKSGCVSDVGGVALFQGRQRDVADDTDVADDNDPFASLQDESLKLKPRPDDYPELPDFLSRQTAAGS